MLIKKYNPQDARLSLLTNQMRLVCQPKLSLKTDKIYGYEILLRHLHNEQGLLSPVPWIDMAEAHGLSFALTKWVFSQAMSYLTSPLFKDKSFSINIPPACCTMEFAKTLLATLKEKFVCPTRVELEITESTPIICFKTLVKAIQYLRHEGIKISIDDFGSGYASMQYLVQLPLDVVKIDKSFIQAAPRVTTARLVMSSLIELAHELSIDVVCEGVETIEQMELIKGLNVEGAQGFLIGKPMPLLPHHHMYIQPLQSANLQKRPRIGFKK